MTCRQVYVAQVAFGADPQQALRAFHEAESYAGPSLILAYSHCVAHGVNMTTAMTHQRQVVQSGLWPLYRFDPRRAGRGESPLQLDSEEPKLPFKTLAMTEARFAMLARTNPDHARQLFDAAQQDIKDRWSVLLEDKKPKP
jgi:pyruvate-ferredoxin/flavodoxin oxidoreductase